MKAKYFLLSAASLLVGFSIQAATISTSASTGNVDFPGSFITDDQGPQSGGMLTSQVEVPFSTLFTTDSGGPATGVATLSDSGSGTVYVEGSFPGGPFLTTASATWSDTITNSSATATAFDFDFLITPAFLAAGSNNSAATAEFAIDILLDGVSIFDAGARLEQQGFSTQLFETGTSLNPDFNFVTDIFGQQVDSYSFDSYADSLSLGLLAPGDSLTVTYVMSVSILNGGESGATAWIGDPFGINGDPGFSGGIVEAQVPVPAAFWLLLSGLLPLFLTRKIR